MTAPSTVCPSCGEPVPFGRRTCEACGANVMETPPSDPAHASDAAQAGVGEHDAAEAGDASPASDSGAESPPPVTGQVAEWPGRSEPAAAPRTVGPETSPRGFVPPVIRDWNAGSPVPEVGFAVELAAAEAEPAGVAGAWLPPAAAPRDTAPGSAMPTMPATPVVWPTASESQPRGRSSGPIPGGAATVPGAMPASLAAMLSRRQADASRWPDESAGGAAGAPETAPPTAPSATLPPSRMPDLGRSSSSAPAASPRAIEPGRATLLADLPFDAPNTLAGWLVAGGGIVATASFLLPWVAVLDSYFGAWGLNSLAQLAPFLLALGTTALAILPSRLADWLRHGVLGVAVGGFLLGLTWPRLVGSTGSQLGVVLEAAGALLLLIGGILAVVRDGAAADRAEGRG